MVFPNNLFPGSGSHVQSPGSERAIVYSLPPGKFFMLFCRLLIFFKINLLKKFFECQIVWIQIRPDILLGLIWVQTVCKSYQQTTLGDKELKTLPIFSSCINVFQLQNFCAILVVGMIGNI